MNLRVRKAVNISGTTTNTYFNYDINNNLIGEYDNSGNVVLEYVYLGNLLVAIIDNSSNVYYVTTDNIMTPRIIRNSSNTIVYQFDNVDPFSTDSPSVNTIGFNLRYLGQYYDSNINLSYNHNRSYNPKTGRYIESDPIGISGGINTYGYVRGNSLSKFDINGLKPGDLFATTEDAVLDAFKWAETQLQFKYVEYGGWIYKTGECYVYTGTTQNNLRWVDIGDRVPNSVATWHTHPPHFDSEGNNDFSNPQYNQKGEMTAIGDRNVSRQRKLKSYLSTPSEGFKVFDPADDSTKTLKNRSCKKCTK